MRKYLCVLILSNIIIFVSSSSVYAAGTRVHSLTTPLSTYSSELSTMSLVPYTSYEFYRTNLSQIYNYKVVEETLLTMSMETEELSQVNSDNSSSFDEENLPTFIFGSSSIQSTDIVQVTGILPTIKALSSNTTESNSSSLAETVAKQIDDIYNKNLELAKDAKASSIDFSYQIKVSGDTYHILITSLTNSMRPIETMDVVTFSADTKSLISINEVLGPNAVTVLNEYINDIIAKDPKTYITNFSGITNEHDFYVEDDKFVLVFDGYEILKGVSETHLISIPINYIRSYFLEASETHTTGKYNVLMIPLRPICDTYGYEINWYEEINTITVSNDDFNVGMTLDKNLYTISGKNTPVTLESPPELVHDGSTYLPISFFEDILGLSYSLDIDGNVIFTSIVPI